MANPIRVKQQLKNIGADSGFWCAAERRELPNILFDDEDLHHLIRGKYEGGFAILCTTNRRVLLIDKKPFYLTVEDIRYEMISDIMYNHRLIDATVMIGTIQKTITFTGYRKDRMRSLTDYIQHKILEIRQANQHSQKPADTLSELNSGGNINVPLTPVIPDNSNYFSPPSSKI